MKAKFYDVKARAKVETEIVDCIDYPNGRSAFKGLTKDGRALTLFCSKEAAEKYRAENGGCKCKKACKK